MIGPKNFKGSAVSDSASDSGILLGLIGALQIGFVLYLYCIVAEKPARRAASRTANVLQTIRWTLSVINLRQNEVAKASGRNSKVANLQLPHLRLSYPICTLRRCASVRGHLSRISPRSLASPHYTVFQKRDAKIEIAITTTNLIRIKYPLSNSNYRLCGANVANFNKIHRTVSEQQLFKNGTQNQRFPVWKSRLSNSYTITSVTVCAQSGRRLHGRA